MGITRRADFPSRPLPASFGPLARQGLGCAGHLAGSGDVQAGRLAPRGLQCCRAPVDKFQSELQRGQSYRPP